MPYRMVTFAIPGGASGTMATLQVMRKLARSAAALPLVRSLTVPLVVGFPLFDQPRVIGDWVAAHTAFVRDPATVEALHTVPLMLRGIARDGIIGVDCDDVAILAAALGLSIGLPCRFIAMAFNGSPFYSHVYTEVGRPGYPVDPTRPAQGFDMWPVTKTASVEV